MIRKDVYITAEGLKKLEDELQHLCSVRRQEVALRLREAIQGGDELIDNAEYEAAKNEQAFVEGRIIEIERMLAQAQIIEHNNKSDTVEIGATVTIKEGNKKPETFKIVGAAEANPKEGMISNESPLGSTLLNKQIGDTVEVEAPDGVIRFKVVKIK
ncbi:MAG: transcription elongation factor GreA [Anaerolineales bacterium]|nr:transcription elongation factor GreA [Anaerolineales bacterium]MCK5633928.1 transcription elongation factor GreA [Anaerolineales bacterium]